MQQRCWTHQCCTAFGDASTATHQPHPKFSEPRSLTFFPFGPSIQFFRMSITSGDSSLNVALIPARASTSPSEWGSMTFFAFSIQWRTVASRSSTLCTTFKELGVVNEDIGCYATSSFRLTFYPTLLRTLCLTMPTIYNPWPRGLGH